MENKTVAKAKKYRAEGYDHGQIRKYLTNEGFENLEITTALKKMDSDEIHDLYQKQKLSSYRQYTIGGFIAGTTGTCYTFYQYYQNNQLDLLTLALFGSIQIGTIFGYWELKKKRFTVREIRRSEKKLNR